jgi:hypothetical protein
MSYPLPSSFLYNVGDARDYIPILKQAKKSGLKLALHLAEVCKPIKHIPSPIKATQNGLPFATNGSCFKISMQTRATQSEVYPLA